MSRQKSFPTLTILLETLEYSPKLNTLLWGKIKKIPAQSWFELITLRWIVTNSTTFKTVQSATFTGKKNIIEKLKGFLKVDATLRITRGFYGDVAEVMDLEHDVHHLIGRLDGLDFEQQIGHRGPGWKVTRKHQARPSGGQGHGPARAALFAHF